jgi:type II secretory pathway pseudopilin PulG
MQLFILDFQTNLIGERFLRGDMAMKLHLFGTLNKTRTKLRFHQGFSIVECVLLILILGVSIWAILSSAMGISNLGAFSREELKAHSVAAGFFDTLEAMPPASFDTDFDGTVREAVAAMGGYDDKLRGYKVVVENLASSNNGVRLVQLTLFTSPVSKKTPLIIRKSLNRFSEKTVDDAIDG